MPDSKENNWNDFWSSQSAERFKQLSWAKKRMLSVMGPYLLPDKLALDAGCGSGFFSKVFCDEGLTTVSLDYSQEALKSAESVTSGRSEIMKADMLENELAQMTDKRFDIIFSDGLLEHFSPQEQDRILGNLVSVLAEGGVVLTFVPNRWSPWQLVRPIFMPGIKETPFGLKGLGDLHERNGLQVLEAGGLNVLPVKFSPEKWLGGNFGMLLYVVAKK